MGVVYHPLQKTYGVRPVQRSCAPGLCEPATAMRPALPTDPIRFSEQLAIHDALRMRVQRQRNQVGSASSFSKNQEPYVSGVSGSHADVEGHVQGPQPHARSRAREVRSVDGNHRVLEKTDPIAHYLEASN